MGMAVAAHIRQDLPTARTFFAIRFGKDHTNPLNFGQGEGIRGHRLIAQRDRRGDDQILELHRLQRCAHCGICHVDHRRGF